MTEDVQPILVQAADWLWAVCELGEDEDLDPEDHLKIIQRAYTSSDCDDFSYMLHQMTEWPVVRAIWSHKQYGMGHHSLVRSPDGRLLDVNGWTTEREVARIYKPRSPDSVKFTETQPRPTMNDIDHEDGISNVATLRAGVIRNLPYAPYDQSDFRKMSMAPLEGVDFPLSEQQDTSPSM